MYVKNIFLSRDEKILDRHMDYSTFAMNDCQGVEGNHYGGEVRWTNRIAPIATKYRVFCIDSVMGIPDNPARSIAM
jgi:hypothetical protein